MRHPSNRTLVRVPRLGGAKRRFVLAAAKHSCGACEAQKRSAGPIVSRSLNSFVFNDVFGLDLFFLNAPRKAHLACHEHRVLGYWIAACCSRSRLVGRNFEDRVQKPLVAIIGCGRPASWYSISNAACALWHFSRKS